MRKKLVVLGLFILLGAIGSPFTASFAQEATISVSATAVKEIAPDTVEINIEVQTDDLKSMQAAMIKNNELSEKLLNNLRLCINSQNGDYIKTSNYHADTLYIYNNGKRSFDKYQVTNTIVVNTKSINKIPSIIEEAIKYGATGVSNLNFSVSNYDEYKDELLTIAIKKAEKQAKVAAKAASVNILSVKSINVMSNDNSYARYHNAAVNFKAADSAFGTTESMAPSIEPGVIKIQAGVNVVYTIN